MKPRASFTAAQVQQLLLPINPTRILKDGKNHNHLSQQDVVAHLIRVFGFGNFDTEVLNVECLLEHNRPHTDGKPSNQWDVGYKALVRLTVRNPDGEVVCRFENGATATAENQKLGNAHDLAYKSAISLAVKRCAINLGDQFGLSLYNKGQMSALVRGSLVLPAAPDVEEEEREDIQTGVPQQLEAGDYDGDYDINQDPEPPAAGLGAALAKRAES